MDYNNKLSSQRQKLSGRSSHYMSLYFQRRALIGAIKFSTGISLTEESKTYFSLVDNLVSKHSMSYAVSRLKNIHHTTQNYCLNLPDPQHPFLATKGGFPRALWVLKKLTKTPNGIQAVLSLTGYYRKMVDLKKQPDFSSIIAVPKVNSDNLEKDIVSKMKTYIQSKDFTMRPPELTFRTKNGPNGQAIKTLMYDLKAIQDAKIFDLVIELLEEQGAEDLASDFEELGDYYEETDKRLFHSRISLKYEGGGKVRPFAMVDYFTQVALMPLHEGLAKSLRTISEDCTFNQSAGINDLKRWSKIGSSYSFDLSSASDRFPITLQVRILAILTSPSFANTWKKLMVDRDYYYKGQTLRWNTGQPLGSYSSWPMFALSHHIVLRYAALTIGIRNPEYYLLGDDIVINGTKLAMKYKEIMTNLGCDFSETKGMSGNAVEFAKRIFYKGTEVSPVPVKLIDTLIKDPILINESVNQLAQRSSNFHSWELRLNPFIKCISTVSGYSLHKLEILTYSPFGQLSKLRSVKGPLGINPSGDLIWPNLMDSPIWEDPDHVPNRYDARDLHKVVKYEYLTRQYNDSPRTTKIKLDFLEKVFIPGFNGQGRQRMLHPAVTTAQEAIASRNARNHKALGHYWSSLRNQTLSGVPSPKVHEFSVECLTASHTERMKHNAKISIITFVCALLAQSDRDKESVIIPEWTHFYKLWIQQLKPRLLQQFGRAKVPPKPDKVL